MIEAHHNTGIARVDNRSARPPLSFHSRDRGVNRLDQAAMAAQAVQKSINAAFNYLMANVEMYVTMFLQQHKAEIEAKLHMPEGREIDVEGTARLLVDFYHEEIYGSALRVVQDGDGEGINIQSVGTYASPILTKISDSLLGSSADTIEAA